MLVDKRTEFADNVDVQNAPGTANVGNQIPLGVAREVGGGDSGKLSVVIYVTETFAAPSTDGTIQFQVASDNTASIATDGTQSIHVKSKAFAEAELVAGLKIVLDLPVQQDGAEPYETFLGLQAVTALQTFTAGAVHAFLSRDIGSQVHYPAPGQA